MKKRSDIKVQVIYQYCGFTLGIDGNKVYSDGIIKCPKIFDLDSYMQAKTHIPSGLTLVSFAKL